MYICKYASVLSREKGYNYWKITETIEKPGNKKLDVDSLKMEILSGISEITRKRVLENMYGSIITDDNKTHGYYIVQWDRTLHKLQEDTDIFHAGDVVCNATYTNLMQQAHHWYTQSTIKTVVHIQHVLAKILTCKNLLSLSNPQTLLILGRPYKKDQ